MKKKEQTIEFPHPQFPILIIHNDGKEMKDIRKCYFQNMKQKYYKEYFRRKKCEADTQ